MRAYILSACIFVFSACGIATANACYTGDCEAAAAEIAKADFMRPPCSRGWTEVQLYDYNPLAGEKPADMRYVDTICQSRGTDPFGWARGPLQAPTLKALIREMEEIDEAVSRN